jgi:translation elongation factor EF-Ts
MDFEKISSFTMDRSSSSIDKDNKRNDIPLWLHLKNEQFQELFRKIVSSISTTTTTLSIEELQQSAMTMYQERKRLHEKQLWLTLLKTIENDGLHRWPTLLKQVILSMNIVRNQSIEYFTDEMYSNVVRIYLQKPIIEQIVQHETMVETILEKYIEDHFHLFDYNYDHDDEQLAYEIQQQLNQNSNQVRYFFFLF